MKYLYKGVIQKTQTQENKKTQRRNEINIKRELSIYTTPAKNFKNTDPAHTLLAKDLKKTKDKKDANTQRQKHTKTREGVIT